MSNSATQISIPALSPLNLRGARSRNTPHCARYWRAQAAQYRLSANVGKPVLTSAVWAQAETQTGSRTSGKHRNGIPRQSYQRCVISSSHLQYSRLYRISLRKCSGDKNRRLWVTANSRQCFYSLTSKAVTELKLDFCTFCRHHGVPNLLFHRVKNTFPAQEPRKPLMALLLKNNTQFSLSLTTHTQTCQTTKLCSNLNFTKMCTN